MTNEGSRPTIRLPELSEIITGPRELEIERYAKHIKAIYTKFGHVQEGKENYWDLSECNDEIATVITPEIVDLITMLHSTRRDRNESLFYIIASDIQHASGSLKAEFLYSKKLAKAIVDTLYQTGIVVKANIETKFGNAEVTPTPTEASPTRRLISAVTREHKRYMYEMTFSTEIDKQLGKKMTNIGYSTPTVVFGDRSGEWADSKNHGLIFSSASEYAKGVERQSMVDLSESRLYPTISLESSGQIREARRRFDY